MNFSVEAFFKYFTNCCSVSLKMKNMGLVVVKMFLLSYI